MVESNPEIHSGEVTKVEDDFTTAVITNPDGQEYKQHFDTELLRKAGISAGDKIQLTFTQDVAEGEINVNMQIKSLGPAQTVEEIQAEIGKIGVDLDLVREKFGSNL